MFALHLSAPANSSRDGRSVDDVEAVLQLDDPELVLSALDFIRRMHDEEIRSGDTVTSKAATILAILGLLGPLLLGLGGFYFRLTSPIRDCAWITAAVGLSFMVGMFWYLIAATAALRAISVNWSVRPAEEIIEQHATVLLRPGESQSKARHLSPSARFRRREVAALLVSYERNKRAHGQIAISLILSFFGVWFMTLFILLSGAIALGYLLFT
jgi:hypothetical protein